MPGRTILAILLCAVAAGQARGASTPTPVAPDAATTASITRAVDGIIVTRCVTVHLSQLDVSWAAADSGSCPGRRRIILHRTGTEWAIVAVVASSPGACPVAGVPDDVALDLLACRPTRAVSEPLLDAYLAARYPAWRGPAAGSWLQCRQESPGGDDWSFCRFAFRPVPTRVIWGRAEVGQVNPGTIVRTYDVASWTSTVRACTTAATHRVGRSRVTVRALRAGGRFTCGRLVARDGRAGRLAAFFTARAGRLPGRFDFRAPPSPREPLFRDDRFRCSARGSGRVTVSCVNPLNDRFVVDLRMR